MHGSVNKIVTVVTGHSNESIKQCSDSSGSVHNRRYHVAQTLESVRMKSRLSSFQMKYFLVEPFSEDFTKGNLRGFSSAVVKLSSRGEKVPLSSKRLCCLVLRAQHDCALY